MFDFLFPNHPFGGHTLRLVAQAQQGGGDVFDIARAMKNVEAGDKGAWEREWLALAQKTEARAQGALAAGHRRTAEQYFFHASNYYRMSDVLLTIPAEPISAHCICRYDAHRGGTDMTRRQFLGVVGDCNAV
jgi:hypothetical protein